MSEFTLLLHYTYRITEYNTSRPRVSISRFFAHFLHIVPQSVRAHTKAHCRSKAHTFGAHLGSFKWATHQNCSDGEENKLITGRGSGGNRERGNFTSKTSVPALMRRHFTFHLETPDSTTQSGATQRQECERFCTACIVCSASSVPLLYCKLSQSVAL